MTPSEFEAALQLIGWKKVDFCRATDTNPTTISRWVNEHNAIPAWVPAHLALLADLQALHAQHLVKPKPSKPAA